MGKKRAFSAAATQAVAKRLKSNCDYVFSVDGSHIKGTDSKGFGIYCRHGGVEYGLSERITAKSIGSVLGEAVASKCVFEKLSNPSMELASALRLFMILNEHKLSHKSVCVRYDYTGVHGWIVGGWQANEPHIAALKAAALAQKKLLEERGVEIEFEKVEGHSGDVENNKADALAKGKLTGLAPLGRLFSAVEKEKK